MIFPRSRKGLLALAGSASLAAAIAIFLAVTLPAGATNKSHMTSAQAMRLIKRSFAVFDRPQRREDRIESPGQRGARESAASSLQSRLVYSGHYGRAYLYAQGTDLCFQWEFGGPPAGTTGGCGHATDAARIGVATIYISHAGGYSSWGSNGPNLQNLQGPGTTMMVAAALPSSVHSITVDQTDGTQETLPVTSNGVVFNASSAHDWQFIDASGNKVIEPIP